jgi:hypothetical protein
LEGPRSLLLLLQKDCRQEKRVLLSESKQITSRITVSTVKSQDGIQRVRGERLTLPEWESSPPPPKEVHNWGVGM